MLSSGALIAGNALTGSLLPKIAFASPAPDEPPFKKNRITETLSSLSRKVPSEGFKIPYGRGGKVIEWGRLEKSLIGSLNDVQKPAGSFLDDMPLLGLTQLGEMMFLKILPLFGSISGPVVGLVMSSLFSYLNGLFSPNSGPSLLDEIKRITGEMIDSNNYELMRLSTKGIYDVYRDFITYLDYFLKQDYRDDSRDQVLNKFDALVAITIQKLPMLRELSNGIGLPLYMQVASIIINAHRELLSRKEELHLDDKYYNTNLVMLRQRSSSWMSDASETIRNRFDEKKQSFNEASSYLREIYTGGYAMLLAAYKASFVLESGVSLDVRNTAELYTDSGTAGRTWESVEALISRDIIKRKSLLSTLEMIGHKNNILRICQEYYDGEGAILKVEGESCSNWWENANAYAVRRDFKINQFKDGDITGDYMPNTFIANTPNQGTYLIAMDSPAGILRAGSGATDGLYGLNIPGHFFSGVVFSTKYTGTCVQNASWGLYTHTGIFRHYDGVVVKQEIAVEGNGDISDSISCEFDLNNSASHPNPAHNDCSGYSDIILGKNICYAVNGSLTMLFRIYPSGDKIKLTDEISYKVLLLISEDSSIDRVSLCDETLSEPALVHIEYPELTTPLYTLTSLTGEKFSLYEVQLDFMLGGPVTSPSCYFQVVMSQGKFASATLVLSVPPKINVKHDRVVAAWNYPMPKAEFLRRVEATSKAGTVFIDMADNDYLNLYQLPGQYKVPLRAGTASTIITLDVIKDSIPPV